MEIEVIREPRMDTGLTFGTMMQKVGVHVIGVVGQQKTGCSQLYDDTEWNDTAWKTTDSAVKFNKLVKEARAELNDNKRRELYYECQRLIYVDGGTICPIFNSYVSACSKAIATDENIAANWDIDGAKCVERWWFA